MIATAQITGASHARFFTSAVWHDAPTVGGHLWARYVWVALLVQWSGMVAYLAWETQQARVGTLMVGPAPGIGRPVTVAEQCTRAWDGMPPIATYLLPYTAVFVLLALGVRYLARNPFDVERARAMAMAFGWVPGLVMTLLGSELYAAVPMVHVALAGCFTASTWHARWVRVAEALAATALGAVWYFFG